MLTLIGGTTIAWLNPSLFFPRSNGWEIGTWAMVEYIKYVALTIYRSVTMMPMGPALCKLADASQSWQKLESRQPKTSHPQFCFVERKKEKKKEKRNRINDLEGKRTRDCSLGVRLAKNVNLQRNVMKGQHETRQKFDLLGNSNVFPLECHLSSIDHKVLGCYLLLLLFIFYLLSFFFNVLQLLQIRFSHHKTRVA